jgi:hypothetical protein
VLYLVCTSPVPGIEGAAKMTWTPEHEARAKELDIDNPPDYSELWDLVTLAVAEIERLHNKLRSAWDEAMERAHYPHGFD